MPVDDLNTSWIHLFEMLGKLIVNNRSIKLYIGIREAYKAVQYLNQSRPPCDNIPLLMFLVKSHVAFNNFKTKPANSAYDNRESYGIRASSTLSLLCMRSSRGSLYIRRRMLM